MSKPRPALSALLVTGLLATGSVLAEDRIEPAPIRPPAVQPPIVQPPIGKPAPPIRVPAVKWTLKTQNMAYFPEKQWGEASEPTSDRGLRVTVQPEQKTFAANGPLAFRVTLTNTGDTPIVLSGGSNLGNAARLVLAHQKTGAQWSLELDTKNTKPLTIAAGESSETTLVVASNNRIIAPPGPGPIPRPVPLPAGPRRVPAKNVRAIRLQPGQIKKVQVKPIQVKPAKAQPARKKPIQVQPGQPIIRPIRPIRPPVVAWPTVPVGQGPVRARLLLEFAKTDAENGWSGKLAANAVDFTIGAAVPVRPPVVGVPTTKEQAIQRAKPIAERALTANYRPVAGVQPNHEGDWLVDADKSAAVTETKTGWRVQWTHTPKGKGFGYNVSVDVNRGGGAVVREVFTSYSPR